MSKAQEAAELYEKLRSVRAVARELGISRSAANDRLRVARKKGLLLPESFEPTKVTRHLVNGELRQQWETSERSTSVEALREFASGLNESLVRVEPTKVPKSSQTGLLTQYTLTDLHFGMLAWGEETRAGDYDLGIAESQLVKWFERAIELAPASEVGLFAQLGDFLHYDSLKAITPEHGNLLDADSRFQKVVRVAARVARQIVAKLLAKHNLVHLKWCSANHDPASSAIFRELLHTLYEREPRVSVDISPSEYYCYEWGQTALFYHHGHRKKPTEVDRVFAALFSELFGRTKFRYAHCGHKHEDRVVETPLMRVEQHRTLAPPDAYAASGGWISGRSASSITYCKKFGEVMRNTISVEALR